MILAIHLVNDMLLLVVVDAELGREPQLTSDDQSAPAQVTRLDSELSPMGKPLIKLTFANFFTITLLLLFSMFLCFWIPTSAGIVRDAAIIVFIAILAALTIFALLPATGIVTTRNGQFGGGASVFVLVFLRTGFKTHLYVNLRHG